jgi:hemerythrin-like domain-containing protein
MLPTEILSAEHRVIEQVLDCLGAIARQAALNGQLDGPSAKDAVSFLRNFADRCHHGKEESHLFPALEAKGFPRDGGPVGVMLAEHEQGRAYIRGMDENIDAAAAGDSNAIRRFGEQADGYIALLRQHIYKEDNILFRLADRTLSDAEQQQLLEKFQHVESDEMGAGTHEAFMDIATKLANRYGLAVAPATTSCGCGGCGCGH